MFSTKMATAPKAPILGCIGHYALPDRHRFSGADGDPPDGSRQTASNDVRVINGRAYVPIADMAKAMGGKVVKNEDGLLDPMDGAAILRLRLAVPTKSRAREALWARCCLPASGASKRSA